MSEEEFLDDMITEASDMVDLCNDVQACLEMATSVECMNDLLGNLKDANDYLDSLSHDIKKSIQKARRFISMRDKEDGNE